ncbi:hypothetical protein MAR_026728 [Mya arenaria]|uniref:EGF-like domain-containing protein n=1 Tax=Mya arenaria TaxID=6604 RepID=A0ABY7EVJ9_MYAAR|nr:multiple epidermal growth factor-like domains protein 11 [Mya arenaria]WAR12548.1 hypothetical protein MAR_026728 [Mya arenaria]
MKLFLIAFVCVIMCVCSTDGCSAWSVCSSSCGGGTKTRHCFSWWGMSGKETATCNALCYNGGTFDNSQCQCTDGWSGKCCQEKSK